MYKAFKITEDDIKQLLQSESSVTDSYNGIDSSDAISKLKERIDSVKDGSEENLNANKIIADWFPEINADIFISHSSLDAELAIKLSSWLDEKFGLTAFIDSQFWFHSNDLLDYFDSKFPGSNDNSVHVNNMLNNALTSMIDKCEGFFFIDSKNSSFSNNSTLSPWIFNELTVVDIIAEELPERKKILMENMSRKADESVTSDARPNIEYTPKYNRLNNLNCAQLEFWLVKQGGNQISNIYNEKQKHPLDVLYDSLIVRKVYRQDPAIGFFWGGIK